MYYRRLLIVLVGFFITNCGGGTSSSTTNSDTESFVYPTENEILVAINEARNQKIDCNDGLGIVGPSQPLVWNTALAEAAYEHSRDLAMTDTFSHDGSGTEYDIAGYNRGRKSFFTERIDDHGYTDYDIVGENIGGGFSCLTDVIAGWLASPGHCANMMNDSFTEFGVGIVVETGTQYGVYWTEEFGHRENK
ncbi:MAG: Transporter [uncultured Sulfurovum sp.]|uniref:Transporter n=1 Tax=uncultured Sulfurovum sp. TaxID=269237 RepID=A0A6S6SB14_9BACT|nr:MAG: Transporter [uncultured Sulfurovum sp.]